MSKPFKDRPDCGAHLDPGEFCNCKDKPAEPANPREPVLIPGA